MRVARLFAAIVLFAATFSSAQTFNRQNYQVGDATQFFAGNQIDRADFNNDGKPDLIVNLGKPGFAVLLNQGGTFTAPIMISAPNSNSVQVGDFNNDHNLDVVACELNGTSVAIQVMLGDGTGHFTPAGSISGEDCNQHIAVGDFNGDGRLDVAVSHAVQGTVNGFTTTTSNSVIVHLGDGSGGFSGTIQTNGLGSPDDSGSGEICAFRGLWGGADVNGDGKVDLAATESCDDEATSAGGLAVLLNDGTGHFSYRRVSTEADVRKVHFRDVDQDGRLDLLFETQFGFPHGGNTEQAWVSLQQSDGSFVEHSLVFETSGDGNSTCGHVGGVDSADINGDGLKDLAYGDDHNDDCVTGNNPDILSLQIRTAPATGDYSQLNPAVSFTLDSPPTDLVWADFNRDGRPDLALLKGNGAVEVFTNTTASAPTCSAASAAIRSVTFCSPANGGTATSPTRVLANITDGYAITGLKIYIDGTSKFVGHDDLVNKFFTLPAGSHKVTVKAWDWMGSFSTSNTFTVSGTSGGSTCATPSTNRTINLCSPVNGSTVSSPVQVLAAVNDSKAVTVKVYVDGVAKFTTTSKQVNFSIALAAGSHRVTVKAWDSSSSTAFSAPSSTFTVK